MTRSSRYLRITVTLLVMSCLALWSSVADESQAGDSQGEEVTLDAELARSLVDEISRRVVELRGLEFKKPVAVEIIDDDVARRHIIDRMESFQSREELETLSEAYQLLGLLPQSFDILEAYLSALREQAGGFYDPDKGSYFLLDDMPASLAPVLTAHELTHALEDQHFDLDERIRGAVENDDELFAISSVHEGSATLLMTAYIVAAVQDGSMDMKQLQALVESETAQAAGLEHLPNVLVRQLIGPYVLGGGFFLEGPMTQLALRGYPTEKINRAYDTSGPRSSEQILHPEKFWDPEQRDEPLMLEASQAAKWLGRDWKMTADGVLGEITLAVMVGDATRNDTIDPMASNESWTVPAAAGWGGDRWELWHSDETALMVLQTQWDTSEDAAEFAAALEGRNDLRFVRVGKRVVVLAGSLESKKARKLLKRILAATPPV